MPPAKKIAAQDDSRSDNASLRERQIAAAAHARKSKLAQQQNGGSNLKDLALVSTETGNVMTPGHNTGMAWNEASLEVLNTYRTAHHLAAPAAFTTPYRQALLTNPGIGRQSPTMARRKEKRRISRDQLATIVRKNFNSAAVHEIDVVVELVYKVRNQDKSFRMRSLPAGAVKK